jgi:PKD repeat protein
MKQLFTFLTFALCFACLPGISFAQLADGSEAPDWTLTDLDGNTHTLYDELDAGRQVYLVFSATWCGPCWNYHNTGHMESIYEDFGPNGTNEARVYFIEADLGTAEACLYGPSGCNGTTQGNWVDGIPFPIINLTSTNGPTVASDYQIAFYPTVYTVCPDKRIYETGQASSGVLETYMTSCEMAPVSVDPYDELCFEDETGGIDIEIIEGHGNTSFSWSNGSSSQNLSDVGQGAYTVTATDGNGVSIEMEGVVGGPDQPLAIQEDNLELEAPCFGDNGGVIELSALGGTPGYTAEWADGTTGFVRTDLPAGQYSIDITDANGCQESQSYEVTEPPLLTLELTRLNENCDQSDGVIIATSGGGTQPYQYDIGFGPSNNNSFIDLPAGNYDLTLTDGNGCEEVESTVIENEPAPVAVAPATLEIDCAGNEIIIDASDSEVESGTDIEWTTSDGNIIAGENSLTPTVDAAGTYTLSLSNSADCSDMAEVVVEIGGDQPIADAGETGELDCAQTSVTIGSNNSSSGPDINYEWLNEAGESIGTTLFVDVEEVGVYTLFVTNTSTGCVAESAVDVIEVSSDLEIAAGVSGQITCSVSEVEISGEGSTSGQNISYEWIDENGDLVSTDLSTLVTGGGEYTLIIVDSETGCTTQETVTVEENTAGPSADLEGDAIIGCDQEPVNLSINTSATDREVVWFSLVSGTREEIGTGDAISIEEAGDYEVEVTNLENGCATAEAFLVEVDENVPTVEIDAPNLLTCLVTEITLDATGSSQGDDFEYEWSTLDGNIVANGSTLTPQVDAAGVYELTIINTENGCENTLSIDVESYDEAPSAELDLASDARTLTFGADYEGVSTSYEWDFGDGNSSTAPNGEHQYAESGSYEVCLTVSNDCGENTYCSSIDITVQPLSASGSVSNIACAGEANGAIQIQVVGGITPYTIEWSTGDSDVTELMGLSAGIYTVLITDGEGTEETLEFEITEPEPLVVSELTITNSSANDDNGSISYTIEGGTPGYTFEWSNGATTQNLDNLPAGEYSLTVTDDNGCVESFGPFTVGVSSSSFNELIVDRFEVYPNPVSDRLNVSIELPNNNKPIEIEIVDAGSRNVYREVHAPTSILNKQISVSDLAAGSYFLRVSSDGQQAVKLFIVK